MSDFHMGILATELSQRMAKLEQELQDELTRVEQWTIRGQIIALNSLARWANEFNGYSLGNLNGSLDDDPQSE
jgi:hypothetical protein